jgi:beta-glucanase (GH16 family)
MRSRRGRWLLLIGIAVLVLVAVTVTVRQGTADDPSASRVVLDDEFDGTALDSKLWNTCHWWDDEGCTISSNDELEWYRPEQVTVRDGVLRLTAERHPYDASDGRTYGFRSGMVTTGPPSEDAGAKVAITYGTVEARVRIPAGRGLWPAVWLLPANRESRPEIDLLEAIGQQPGEVILHLHPADRDADSPSRRVPLSGADLAAGWHTVGMSWSPGRLVYLLDGRAVWTLTGDQVPSQPMYLVLNLAVGGAYPGSPDDSTRFPATFEIDYVRMSTGA